MVIINNNGKVTKEKSVQFYSPYGPCLGYELRLLSAEHGRTNAVQ